MYKENHDGATKSLYALTKSLLQENFDVKILAFSITDQKKEGLSIFKVRSIPIIFYPEYKLAFPSLSLLNKIKKYKPDIIHISVPDLVGIFLIKYAKKKNIPLIESYHTDFLSYLKYYKIGFIRKLMEKFFRWFYNQSETVFVPTRIILDDLAEKGIKNTKIWSRGVYPGEFDPSYRSDEVRKEWGTTEKHVILYSGRFVWYKGLRSVIEVYNTIKEKGPDDVVMVLLGSGPAEKELKRTMPDAIFPGYLSGSELSTAYASADIFLFPSTTETFGMVVLESLSSGIPVIVSDIGGCQEIAGDSGGGLIAKAESTEEFYNCCKKILLNQTLSDKLKSRGLFYSNGKTWNEVNRTVISTYKKIVNQIK